MSQFYKPSYRLEVNGQNITPKINGRLVNMTLTDERGHKSDQLDIVLDDHDGRLSIPPRNATLRVWFGWDGQLVYKGLFILDEASHAGPPDTLTLRARASDFKGPMKVKRQQSWHNVTLGDILTTVARRSALVPIISAELAGVTIDHIDQTDESDHNLLQRLGERYDALHSVKDGRLLFTPAGQGDTVGGQALPSMTITRQQGDAHQYQQTDREHEYTGVQAHWHNTDTGQQETVTAGTDENAKVLRHMYPTPEEAKSAAKGEWQRISRAGSKLTLNLAIGIPDWMPETPIKAQGFKPEIDGTDWVTERVVHSLSESGYTVRVGLEIKL
jgi:phage protein D